MGKCPLFDLLRFSCKFYHKNEVYKNNFSHANYIFILKQGENHLVTDNILYNLFDYSSIYWFLTWIFLLRTKILSLSVFCKISIRSSGKFSSNWFSPVLKQLLFLRSRINYDRENKNFIALESWLQMWKI